MLAVSLLLAVIAASEVVYWLDFMLIGHAVFWGALLVGYFLSGLDVVSMACKY